MAYAHAAPDLERLPWLKNEPTAPAKPSETPLLLTWALVATAVIAGASYWVGSNSRLQPPSETLPSATVWLPQPVESEAAPALAPVMPQVEPVAEPRDVTIPPRREVRRPRRTLAPMERDEALPAVVADQQTDAAPVEKGPDPTLASREELTYWPASESEGAAGRVVRIGTFASRIQAKRAWWKVVKAYPGMKTLKAVVAPVPSRRNGRTYYRLQFGTTSQAHSAVLCQRMLMIRVSCAVVGVPDAGGAA